MQLLSLPKMLIVHLSRFAYDAKTRRNTKVSKPVRFDSRLACVPPPKCTMHCLLYDPKHKQHAIIMYMLSRSHTYMVFINNKQ